MFRNIDEAGPPGPEGPQGEQGPQGEIGPQGAAGVSPPVIVPLWMKTVVNTTGHMIAPVAGTIDKAWIVADDDGTDGTATITGSIEGSPITGGVMDLINASPGDTDSCTPSAANTVAEGAKIAWAVTGDNILGSSFGQLYVRIIPT